MSWRTSFTFLLVTLYVSLLYSNSICVMIWHSDLAVRFMMMGLFIWTYFMINLLKMVIIKNNFWVVGRGVLRFSTC